MKTVLVAVGGAWGAWSGWSECSSECGGGTQIRSKQCNDPAPANGGAECEGESTEVRECNTQSCPGTDTDTNSLEDLCLHELICKRISISLVLTSKFVCF